tara:strand:+ start:223 stop:543 length:321 start_codon:yes stop_codon:yes gene_type:complete
MKKPIHALTISVVIIVFAWLMIERAQADDLFGGESFFNSEPSKSDTNFLWEGDGSLTVVTGAKESGYVIKDGEVETYVVPSDTGNTFINNGTTGELIICNSAMGCY